MSKACLTSSVTMFQELMQNVVRSECAETRSNVSKACLASGATMF